MNIIEYFKDIFEKANIVKCDKILTALNNEYWYGIVGKEIHYQDFYSKLPVFSIILSKNNIKFIISPDKKEFFTNIGLVKPNKKERIYIYSKIELFMLKLKEEQSVEAKTALLNILRISEQDFNFLVNSCKG